MNATASPHGRYGPHFWSPNKSGRYVGVTHPPPAVLAPLGSAISPPLRRGEVGAVVPHAEAEEPATRHLSPAERGRGRTWCSTPRSGEGAETRPITIAEKSGPSTSALNPIPQAKPHPSASSRETDRTGISVAMTKIGRTGDLVGFPTPRSIRPHAARPTAMFCPPLGQRPNPATLIGSHPRNRVGVFFGPSPGESALAAIRPAKGGNVWLS